jgi:hypothetical protein
MMKQMYVHIIISYDWTSSVEIATLARLLTPFFFSASDLPSILHIHISSFLQKKKTKRIHVSRQISS